MSKILHRIAGVDDELEVYRDYLYLANRRKLIKIRELVELELRDELFVIHLEEEAVYFPFDPAKMEVAGRIGRTVDGLLWERDLRPRLYVDRKVGKFPVLFAALAAVLVMMRVILFVYTPWISFKVLLRLLLRLLWQVVVAAAGYEEVVAAVALRIRIFIL